MPPVRNVALPVFSCDSYHRRDNEVAVDVFDLRKIGAKEFWVGMGDEHCVKIGDPEVIVLAVTQHSHAFDGTFFGNGFGDFTTLCRIVLQLNETPADVGDVPQLAFFSLESGLAVGFNFLIGGGDKIGDPIERTIEIFAA
ncbi:MAG: hypothetical protein ACD_75C00029G0002 [uncultured bacterium]|nr:MAG: hypothetical protein ACD_75C00029G0002 [uncultured bacterium]